MALITGEIPNMTDGQLLIGSSNNTPVAAQLTAGSGISITPAAGAITITNSNPTAASTPNAAVYYPDIAGLAAYGDVSLTTNNRVWVYSFNVTASVTFIKGMVRTNAGGTTFYLGAYTFAGNLVGGSSVATAAGAITVTFSPSLVLTPGTYYLACALANVGGAAVGGVTIPANMEAVLNTSKVRAGFVANGISAGAFQSTMGALSAPGGAFSLPWVKLETT